MQSSLHPILPHHHPFALEGRETGGREPEEGRFSPSGTERAEKVQVMKIPNIAKHTACSESQGSH